jgi:endonuclease/exonuclease/phosphatase family metal-dependent hydrolase
VKGKMAVSVVTLNIEGHHHLDRFLPFLRTEKPDVVCLQEVFACDIDHISTVLELEATFVPTLRIETENKYRMSPLGEWGVAILTALPHSDPQVERYRGEGSKVPIFAENPNDPWRVLLSTTVEKEGAAVQLATTHFTWSKAGATSDEQRRDFAELKKLTDQYEKLVLCGDFNVPRGGELWSLFSQDFVDFLPEEVESTLDPLLHYAAPLDLVVDGFFVRGYECQNVRVVPGVSDHQAIVGEVTTGAQPQQ